MINIVSKLVWKGQPSQLQFVERIWGVWFSWIPSTKCPMRIRPTHSNLALHSFCWLIVVTLGSTKIQTCFSFEGPVFAFVGNLGQHSDMKPQVRKYDCKLETFESFTIFSRFCWIWLNMNNIKFSVVTLGFCSKPSVTVLRTSSSLFNRLSEDKAFVFSCFSTSLMIRMWEVGKGDRMDTNLKLSTVLLRVASKNAFFNHQKGTENQIH